ncbi:MAG: response regulator [Anaerolineales bacterium]
MSDGSIPKANSAVTAPSHSSREDQNGNSKEPEAFKASVLVIDDEPAFCFAISEILRLAGYDVRLAHDARHALASLKEDIPDLILTDVMMPDIDGLTFLRTLRSDPAWASTPTIAVSAKAAQADITAAREAGADAYLAKPFSAKDLQDAIRPFVNGNSPNGHD